MFEQIKRFQGVEKFSSMQKLMDYALNEIGVQGTHIYVTDLKTNGDSGELEITATSDDLVLAQLSNSSHEGTFASMFRGTGPWLVESSMSAYAKFMYLKHPKYLHLQINGQRLPQLSNPFNKLIGALQQDSTSNTPWKKLTQIKTNEYAVQALNKSYLDEVLADGQHLQKFLSENSNFDQNLLLQLAQGLLVYHGNRFVKRHQGGLASLEERAQVISDLMQDTITDERSGDNEFKLGKRTFTQKNQKSRRDLLLASLFKVSGVAYVFTHAAKTSLDKTVSS